MNTGFALPDHHCKLYLSSTLAVNEKEKGEVVGDP